MSEAMFFNMLAFLFETVGHHMIAVVEWISLALKAGGNGSLCVPCTVGHSATPILRQAMLASCSASSRMSSKR
jgi:hypothetical protein